MLMTLRRKALYLLLTASVALFLIGAPTVVPSVHADCSSANSSNCET